MANNYSMTVVKKANALFNSGKTLKQISKMKGMPTERTLLKWVEQEHGGKWEVRVREIRAFVDPIKLQKDVENYFNGLEVKSGRWEELPVVEEVEGVNMVVDFQKKWIADLDEEGNQAYKLKEPPSWVGLALALGVSAKTLDNYKAGKFDEENCKYSEILEIASDMIHKFNMNQLYSRDGVNGAKFMLSRYKQFREEYDPTKKDDSTGGKKLEDFLKND